MNLMTMKLPSFGLMDHFYFLILYQLSFMRPLATNFLEQTTFRIHGQSRPNELIAHSTITKK